MQLASMFPHRSTPKKYVIDSLGLAATEPSFGLLPLGKFFLDQPFFFAQIYPFEYLKYPIFVSKFTGPT